MGHLLSWRYNQFHVATGADALFLLHEENEGTTIMQIVVECQKQFREKYFNMTANDWRHLISDYVRKSTSRPELREDEAFHFSVAG